MFECGEWVGGWMPLPTRPQRFCDPASLVNSQQAILAVGEVIQDYNLKNEFVAVGFGAKIPPNGELSHNFPLGLRSPADPCRGIQGVIQVQIYTHLHHGLTSLDRF